MVEVVVVAVVMVDRGQDKLPTSENRLTTNSSQKRLGRIPGYDHLYVVLSNAVEKHGSGRY